MDYRINCPHCGAELGVMAVQVGTSLRCPHCDELFLVGVPDDSPKAMTSGRAFSFPCELCHSRLEAYPAMVGKSGQCPTCGAEFTIPAPRQIARRTAGTVAETEYRQPVHAFAAAGAKAPEIVKLSDDRRAIRCPRCRHLNDVQANHCRQCAAPFTLDGAEGAAVSHMPAASLILGIVGLPTAPVLIPSALATIFGLIALSETRGDVQPGRVKAMIGLTLGLIGVGIAVVVYFA